MPAPRGGLVYHWKHGWIPRDHFAALQKAHGSHAGAAKIMDRHGIAHDGSGHSAAAHPVTRSHPVGARVEARQPGIDRVTHGAVVGHTDSGMVKVQHTDRHGNGVVGTFNPLHTQVVGTGATTHEPRAGGAPHLLKSDVHGDGRTDLYKLPSGHEVSVDRSTGRVLNPFVRDASGKDAIDANPHLLQKKSVGSSIAHDDHYVLAGHDKSRVAAESKAKAQATAPGLSREDLRVAVLRGHMTDAQAVEHIRADSARISAARSGTGAEALAARGTTPRVHVDHSGDGTLLHIDRSDTQAREAAKAAGFRWSSNLGSWYLPRNWSESTRRQKVADLQRSIGPEHVHVEDKGHGVASTAAERETVKRAAASARADRMDSRAEKAATEADVRFGRAKAIGDMIPLGQPILAGHHSQRRHERDIARIGSNMDKGVQAQRESQAAEAAAARARQTAAGDSPLLRQRRVDRNEAELRAIDRTLQDHQIATKAPAAAARVGMKPLTLEHHARLTATRARLADEIAHDRSQIEASGFKAPSSSDIKPGDVIHYRGRTHVVAKVNKTTVSVPTGYSWDDKVPLNQITKHQPLSAMPDDAVRNAAGSSTHPKVKAAMLAELKRRGLAA